ncbi:MAG: ABC transporter permease, partial [Acidimicrobiia bacterium]
MASSIRVSTAPETLDAVTGGISRPGVLRRLLRTLPGRVGVALTALVITAAIVGPWVVPHGPFELAGPPLSPPNGSHPMGTDALGRDLLSGIVHGTRTSLVIGAGVGILVAVIGTAVGALSGYLGGRIDDMLMRLTEIVQAMPQFFLAIVAIALFRPGVDTLVVMLGLTSWVVFARVVRAEVISLRHREFVEAARAQGASRTRVLL